MPYPDPFYPVVDSLAWVERLTRLGVGTIQLRAKDLDDSQALELGYDAVLLNTAIAKAADPVGMASAFRSGVEAGRAAYESGLMEARDFASPSTPVVGTPFWHALS